MPNCSYDDCTLTEDEARQIKQFNKNPRLIDLIETLLTKAYNEGSDDVCENPCEYGLVDPEDYGE